ncbi:hybrid sensor histidine kinase/response regulator [Paraburkholderia ginsengiterrae]|uniref:Virulence sensor protein BvgS n=1 Tax=Paraburkholderia ginsengiterrae TaxID=1462993 RepID=A0A1A9N3A6_9BURK|nr:ATP-binding protein [Paraburkholderia ginsengiterrae]OAJ56089.1 hybrid sensor histidine kinase/response regulator [Paraburkholderia ginsengiterrae]OAJ61894.1 hybrid sensor histidine kinase/response regulator [Paraburkholderia ginsengiterrae]
MKLPLPQSLTAQFTLVVSCLAALVVAVSATTIYSLAGSAHAIRQLAEERLARQEEAQDLAQRTVMIERLALQLSSDDTADAVRETHRHVIEQLAFFDRLVDRLASATTSDDVGVDALALHRSSQRFRNTINIEAQVRETALGSATASASASASAPASAPRPGASLASLDDDLRRQADALAAAAHQQSDYFTRDYRKAVQDLADDVDRTRKWVGGEVAVSLLLAWLIARAFLGRHVVARLRRVSHFLRHGDVDGTHVGVPVHGGDEIADMARAVEQFLEDRRQRRQAEDALKELNAELEARVTQRTAELSTALAGQTAEIVERQHAEEAARASEHFLDSIIENIPDMIFVKDAATLRFVRFNKAGEQLLGARREELIGKSVHDLFPTQEADFFALKDRDVLESRLMVDVPEEPVHTRHGPRLVHTMKIPILDVRGDPQFLLGISRDITEQKRAEEELRRYREHLEDMIRERTAELAVAKEYADAANQAKSDFLAHMSHEVRTPLNGILGYAQILKRDKSLDQRQVDGITVIQRSGEHLLAIINDILDMAKIEAGRVELSLSDILLDRFIDFIAETIRVKAAEKGLAFACEMAPDLPAGVRLDEQRLRQVLLNLLSNAIKFTEAGGVRLRVGCLPPNRLRFEVQDTGIGIEEAHLETIFRPFEQVSDAQHRVGGTGLGLAISRQLVRLMGGEIHVESRRGAGSIFSFELNVPVVAPQATAVPPEWTASGYKGARKTVLVVDDIAANRAVAVDMLEQLGFDMVEAGDGLEALEKAKALRPALILMDVVMPGMDGLEATRRLREMPEFGDLPIIAVSAGASGSDTAKSLAAGANAFLSKPIDFSGLLLQIAALLNIEWGDEVPQTQGTVAGHAAVRATDPSTGTLIVPPHEEIEALHYLARLGDMRTIVQRAVHLTELDERYRPFADHLCQLAKNYQSKALLSFVEQYLERRQVP